MTTYSSTETRLLLHYSLVLPVATAFHELLLLVEDVTRFNHLNATNFKITFLEVAYPVSTRAHDAHMFAYNEVLAVVNYHLCQSRSPKLWWFCTRCSEAGLKNINAAGIELNIASVFFVQDPSSRRFTDELDESTLFKMIRYLRCQVQGDRLQRQADDPPPLGINAKGEVFPLPAPTATRYLDALSFKEKLHRKLLSDLDPNHTKVSTL